MRSASASSPRAATVASDDSSASSRASTHSRVVLRFASIVVVAFSLLSLAMYMTTITAISTPMTRTMRQEPPPVISLKEQELENESAAPIAPSTVPTASPTNSVVTNAPLELILKREPRRSTTPLDPTKKYAYMFYVTDDDYACGLIHFLRQLINKVQMDPSIHLVVLHVPEVTSNMLNKIQHTAAVRLIAVDALKANTTSWTWMMSLTKLHAFRDWGYDRVVFFDTDAVPLQNLDHLFNLPPAQLYAPTAYWLEQPFFASTLLVIEPSDSVFSDIMAWVEANSATAGFDMDILNAFFKDSVQYLPAEYTVLNSDLLKQPHEVVENLNKRLDEVKKDAKLVHFSSLPDGTYGKPWYLSEIEAPAQDEALDPLFMQLFRDFWATQQYCLD